MTNIYGYRTRIVQNTMILNIRIIDTEYYKHIYEYTKKNELNQLQDAEDHNRAFQGGRAASSWWICGIRAETWVYRNKDELFFRFLHSVLVFLFHSFSLFSSAAIRLSFCRLPAAPICIYRAGAQHSSTDLYIPPDLAYKGLFPTYSKHSDRYHAKCFPAKL